MKLKYISKVFIPLIFISVFSYSQENYNIEWTPDYTMGTNKHQIKNILKDEINEVNYTVYQKLNKLQTFNLNEFILNKFSKNQNFIFSKTIVLPIINKEKVKLLSVEIIKGQLIVLAYYKNPKSREGSVIAFSIDKEGNLGKHHKKLFNYKLNNNDKNNLSQPINISWSKDKSKLLLYRINSKPQKYFSKKTSPLINVIILNSQLELIWNENITIDNFKGFFKLHKCLISNSGNVHLLYSSRLTNSYNKYNYSLISLFQDKSSKYLTIDLEKERLINEVDFIWNNNKLIFSGTFTNDKNSSPPMLYSSVSKTKLNQMFYFQLDETSHHLDFKYFNKIEKEIINKIVGQKKEGFSNLNIINFFPTKKGNYYVIGEVGSLLSGDATFYNSSTFYFNVENHRYSSIRKRLANLGNKVSYGYNFQDIIIFKYNEKGNLIWQKTFEKNRSILSLYKNILSEKLTFIFNENPENNGMKLEKSNKGTLKKTSKVIQVDLSSEGKLEKKHLISTYNSEKYLETEYFLQNGKYLYIINSGDSEGKLKQCWLKLEIN